MNGFHLFPEAINASLEKQLINVIENDYRFMRYFKTGKIFYQMSPEGYPPEWIELLRIIRDLHESCKDFDYSLQLKYEPGVSFSAHYDSKNGIKKVKELRYSITLRKKTEFEKNVDKPVN